MSRGPLDDAPNGSGRVLARWVAVSREFQHLSRDMELLREFIATRRPEQKLGVRVHALAVATNSLSTALLQMALEVVGEEMD